MMPISLFIAYRYLFKTKKEKSISAMIKICLFSITISTFSLALILSIMNGFETATNEKIQNINPQIILQANNKLLNFKQIKNILEKEFKEIEFFSPSDSQYAIINTNDEYDISNVVIIKGIDPQNEQKINKFAEKITYSGKQSKKLDELLEDGFILIGEKLSKNLNLNILDNLSFLIPQSANRSKKIEFISKESVISGLFNTGIDEFDNKFIICSLTYFKKIFPNSGITQIGIKLKPNTDEQTVISRLKKRFMIDVYGWKDLYPALVSALKLEKYVMVIILLLVALIASMNIISLLFMLITQKKGDIAILKSLGLSNFEIKKIFILIGLFITLIGNIFGLFLAFIAGKILINYPFIKLPDVYYVTHLPIKMELSIFIFLFIIIILIGLIATLIPTKKLSQINISQAIKMDA